MCTLGSLCSLLFFYFRFLHLSFTRLRCLSTYFSIKLSYCINAPGKMTEMSWNEHKLNIGHIVTHSWPHRCCVLKRLWQPTRKVQRIENLNHWHRRRREKANTEHHQVIRHDDDSNAARRRLRQCFHFSL